MGKTSSTDTTWTRDKKGFRFNLSRANLILKRPLLNDSVYAGHTKLLSSGELYTYIKKQF